MIKEGEWYHIGEGYPIGEEYIEVLREIAFPNVVVEKATFTKDFKIISESGEELHDVVAWRYPL